MTNNTYSSNIAMVFDALAFRPVVQPANDTNSCSRYDNDNLNTYEAYFGYGDGWSWYENGWLGRVTQQTFS